VKNWFQAFAFKFNLYHYAALGKAPEFTELPDGIGGDGNGDADEAHLQVMVTAERLTKTVTYTEREVPPPPKPPWRGCTSSIQL
jgi:hypothetical protein